MEAEDEENGRQQVEQGDAGGKVRQATPGACPGSARK
jgi:hypothetical protein